MHELLLGAVPAAAGAWYGTRAWLARRNAPIGEPGPGFRLRGTDGHWHDLEDLATPVVVLLFMSNKCPGVKAYDGRLRRLMAKHAGQATFVGVNSIDDGLHPGESLAAMRRALADRRLDMLYLKDARQEVAHAYGAICTPEVVVLDRERRIRYRGRIDDAIVEREARRPFLDQAIAALVRGRAPRVRETAPLGCSIDPMGSNAIVASARHPAARA